MTVRDFIRKVSSFWIFDRWHPEVALRYLPIVAEINRSDKNATILEVGSGGMGIAPYVKKIITGVDREFKKPFHKRLKQVVATGEQLPFQNRSFDIVINLDMLEHLENHKRSKVIYEMLRVAKKKVLIGVPCGKSAYLQDISLNELYQKKYGKGYHFLDEQITYGLPEKADIERTITSSAKSLRKRITISNIGNENLSLRQFLMRGWIMNNMIAQVFFRKVLLLFIPFFSLFNRKPYYRQLFFVTIYENRN